MPKEVKFNEEELKKIQNIQNEYTIVQNTFGQLTMAKLRLESQMDSLIQSEDDNRQKLEKLQEDEKKFLDGITDKYGQGTLNPETGVFIQWPKKSYHLVYLRMK
jgi:predicted nuclease with TOPRIM domain